jgi:hypothetical protein
LPARFFWSRIDQTKAALFSDFADAIDNHKGTYFLGTIVLTRGEGEVPEVSDGQQRSQARALEFLDELAESATHYAALFNSDHKKWNEYGTNTRKHINTINTHLRVLQIRPLMFAMANIFSLKKLNSPFVCLSFGPVRFLIVGGRGGLLDHGSAVNVPLIRHNSVRRSV